jgi:hypothetical protein
MEKQLGSKDGELSIVHEGYKGAIVGKKTCVVECWKIPWVEKWIRGRSIL